MSWISGKAQEESTFLLGLCPGEHPQAWKHLTIPCLLEKHQKGLLKQIGMLNQTYKCS